MTTRTFTKRDIEARILALEGDPSPYARAERERLMALLRRPVHLNPETRPREGERRG